MVAFIWGLLGSTKHMIERGGYHKYLGYVPFLNVFLFFKVSTKPLWWFVFIFIPVVNLIVFSLVVLNHLDTIGISEKRRRLLIVIFFPYMSRGVL